MKKLLIALMVISMFAGLSYASNSGQIDVACFTSVAVAVSSTTPAELAAKSLLPYNPAPTTRLEFDANEDYADGLCQLLKDEGPTTIDGGIMKTNSLTPIAQPFYIYNITGSTAATVLNYRFGEADISCPNDPAYDAVVQGLGLNERTWRSSQPDHYSLGMVITSNTVDGVLESGGVDLLQDGRPEGVFIDAGLNEPQNLLADNNSVDLDDWKVWTATGPDITDNLYNPMHVQNDNYNFILTANEHYNVEAGNPTRNPLQCWVAIGAPLAVSSVEAVRMNFSVQAKIHLSDW